MKETVQVTREAFRDAMVAAARAQGGAGEKFIADGHSNLWLDIAYDAAARLSATSAPAGVEGLREALAASLAKRSVPTMDPPWSKAFNAALDMVGRDTGVAAAPAPSGQEVAGEQVVKPCTIPPEGWCCSRAAGHEGPCAASAAGFADGVSGSALGFAEGQMMLNRDGSGAFSFKDDDLEWEPVHDSSVDYRVMKLPASEVLAIRDHLNKHFPPAPTTPPASGVTVPEGEVEREWGLPVLRDLHTDVQRIRDHDLGNIRMRELLRATMDTLMAADAEYAALSTPSATPGEEA